MNLITLISTTALHSFRDKTSGRSEVGLGIG